jgi:hypothetical protein
MKPADRKAFLEIVIGFAELKGKPLSAPALELYWRAMQDWDIANFRAAAEQLLRSCEFMPTPKDFEDLRKAARMSSGEAWALVLDSIRGYGELPNDPALHAAVRALGGIRALGMLDSDQMPFLERRFAEHYEQIGERTEVRQALPDLSGLTRALPYDQKRRLS